MMFASPVMAYDSYYDNGGRWEVQQNWATGEYDYAPDNWEVQQNWATGEYEYAPVESQPTQNYLNGEYEMTPAWGDR